METTRRRAHAGKTGHEVQSEFLPPHWPINTLFVCVCRDRRRISGVNSLAEEHMSHGGSTAAADLLPCTLGSTHKVDPSGLLELLKWRLLQNVGIDKMNN